MDNSTNKKSRKRTKMADELNTNNPQDGTSSSTLSLTEGAPLPTEKNAAKESKKSKKRKQMAEELDINNPQDGTSSSATSTSEEALLPTEKNAAKKSKKSKKREQIAEELDTNNFPDGTCSSTLSKTKGTFIPTKKNGEVYNLSQGRRMAIIFNHLNVNGFEDPRNGTEADKESLQRSFGQLQFEVKTYDDPSYEDIKKILKEASEEDHSNTSCFLLFVLTHGGGPGKLWARDQSYAMDDLWDSFTPDNCKGLAGKPKIFCIQACQGRKVDKGVIVSNTETDDVSWIDYKLPILADFLVFQSTPPGHKAWRCQVKGSWFVQAFCQVLDEEAGSKDLLSMTTRISRRVALDYESRHQEKRLHEMKQIPQLTSRLIRDLFFTRKFEDDHREEKMKTETK